MDNSVKSLLGQTLNKSNIKDREIGGRKVFYLEGWYTISEANRIFGFDGWSRETLELVENTPPTQNDKKNYVVSFRARVRLNVHGVIRDGIGYGSGISKSIHDAYESAIKEAETDAMKRAFMTFGNPLGLALYDKSMGGVSAEVISLDKAVNIDKLVRETNTNLEKFLDLMDADKIQNIKESDYTKAMNTLLERKKKQESGSESN